MKLAIDVMGFENDIIEPIKACRKFKRQHQDVEFILVGNKDKIQSLIKPNEFIIHPANDVIKMDDNPMIAMRKTDSSMYQAIQLVQNNQADGVLSAGSSSCYVPMSYLMLKLIDGINKPAFMPYVPTNNGKGFMLIDCGANKECSGEDLYQFAIMANIYCQTIRHINKPTIGVINIGTEAEKGLSHHHTANELLKKDQSLNYIGFVEPRYLLNGSVDIAVCDGYTGNITLKALEGGLSALKDSLKKEYKKPWNWLGAISSLFAIKALSKTFDYRNNAGAIVLGLQKVAIKTHGNADAQQFYSSIEMLYDVVKNKVVEQIKESFNKH